MTYPTPPGPRIAYDVDGTRGFFKSNYKEGGVFEVPQSFLRFVNTDASNIAGLRGQLWWSWDTSGDTGWAYGQPPRNAWFGLGFPVAMRIRAVAASMWWAASNFRVSRLHFAIETSSDSTNGQDGTWSLLYNHTAEDDFGGQFGTTANSSPPPIPPGHGPLHRSQASYPYPETVVPLQGLTQMVDDPTYYANWEVGQEPVFVNRRKSFDESGVGWHPTSGVASRHVMWLRLRVTAMGATVIGNNISWEAPMIRLHLYGEPDTSADTQRLAFVTTGGADKLFFDFGDVDPSETLTQQFRVKNLHGSLTANNVTVRVNAPNTDVDNTPSATQFCKLSTDGVNWTDYVSFASIAPGGTSDIITLRVKPQTGLLGPWSPRLSATVEGWA